MFIFMYEFINSHGYSRNTQSIVSKRYQLKISIKLKKKMHIQFIITCWATVPQALMVRTKLKKKDNKQQNKTYFNKRKRLLLFSSFHTDTYPVFWPVTLGTGIPWVWWPGLDTVRTKIKVHGQVEKLLCYGKHFWIWVMLYSQSNC